MACRRPGLPSAMLAGWRGCSCIIAAPIAISPGAGAGAGARGFATVRHVKPSGFVDLKKYLTDFEGHARKKGRRNPAKRGPPPAAYMEYGASTVIRQTVARKAPGGNIRKYKVTSVVGNGKGWAGIGVAQSADNGRAARTKSLANACKNMFYIERYRGRTVYHAVQTKLGATKVELWPRRTGSGVKAGRIAQHLLQRLGITDVGVKVRGSKNKTMQLKATVKALSMIESHEEAAKRRGVMLPRLNYHDYRRVCAERSEAAAHGLLFAEEEPGASMPGLKAARPRPSLPMLGLEGLRTDKGLSARWGERKVAFAEAQRKRLLGRLQTARDRSDSLIYDRIEEELADVQAELAEEAERNEAVRLERLAALEAEKAELAQAVATLDPELLAQATPQHWKAEKLERRKEAEEIVFRDYKKRVVDDPQQLAQADSGSGGSGDDDEGPANDGSAKGFRKV